MTIEEFDITKFSAGLKAMYKSNEYPVVSVDFEEKLIGLRMEISGGDPDEISWVRCENAELVYALQLENNCVEYRDQAHEMWIEGTCDHKPTEWIILGHAAEREYFVTNIEIWFDDLQGIWRFKGDLIKMQQ